MPGNYLHSKICIEGISDSTSAGTDDNSTSIFLVMYSVGTYPSHMLLPLSLSLYQQLFVPLHCSQEALISPKKGRFSDKRTPLQAAAGVCGLW
ncbi:hypothetical protein LENED_000822 [Lentinula edodes]|uniref:Uncharacterized protein n=1 Tax=Lentinula edodes TaxID=5353 RepID=A0A1Q3DWR0_LENED|nr:hypothetical protein LENED_000822 [Lentinula edodes]